MVRTIKYLQMLLILGSLSLGTVTYGVTNEGPDSCPMGMVRAAPGDDHGGSHPWPWGFEVRFPWENVQGIWRVKKGDTFLYFSFRRVHAKRIKIKQIDPTTCFVIGAGQGLEKDKTVVAQIRNALTDETYNLTLYAFNEEDAPEPPVLSDIGPSELVVVARFSRLDRVEPEFAGQMVRISNRLEFACGSQEKKTKF